MNIVSLGQWLPLFEPSWCGAAIGPPQDNCPSGPEHEVAFDGNQLRVLWIDDEVNSGDAEVHSLELEAFHVDCAKTGAEGISLAEERTFDAILLDLRLPDKSGLDVLARLMDVGVAAPVIILTGFAEVETGIAAMKLGAADYRTKPFEATDIAPLLRNLVAQRNQHGVAHRPHLAEIEWLRLQCGRFAGCVTRRHLISVMLRILLDRRVTLTCFFGCAEALRLVLTGAETSLTLLAASMRDSILRAAKIQPPRNPKLRDALERLEHDAPKLSQQMFAGRVGLSRAYLSHLVTVQTGRYASEWCRAALMRAVLRQVLETREQISQIAYAAGYQYPGQFDRDFAGMFGASPTDLRRIFTSTQPHQC